MPEIKKKNRKKLLISQGTELPGFPVLCLQGVSNVFFTF